MVDSALARCYPRTMPLYEFRCPTCESKDDLFVRSLGSPVVAPACRKKGCANSGSPMVRAMSKFARHLTESDKMVEAEGKWGKEVNHVLGASPDIDTITNRYARLSKDLPPPDNPALH